MFEYLQCDNHLDNRLEPSMLKIYLLFLPKPIPKNFTHYTYFIPIAPPIIPFLFYCVNDNNGNVGVIIYNLHSLLQLTDCFNRMFDCSIRVPRSSRKLGGRTSKYLGSLGPARPVHDYATV